MWPNRNNLVTALRLALFHMQKNEPCFSDSSRGSVVLVTSTSGYFGSSGVGAYVASKHALVGLLRSCQLVARSLDVKVNAVAPFFTPTQTFSKLSKLWTASGLKANKLTDVSNAIAQMALIPGSGQCVLVLSIPFRFLVRWFSTKTTVGCRWTGERDGEEQDRLASSLAG